MDPRGIYEDLKKRIINLEIAPEVNLNLSGLADYYGMSRTPVKEAVIYLEADGWVYRNGNHFTVSSLTLERMRENTQIRLILEVEANVMALRNITPQALATLQDILNRIANLDESADNQELVQLDTEFHTTLYQASGNKQLAVLLERMLMSYLRFWLSRSQNIMHASFFDQAQQIVEAIKQKDEGKLRELTIDHIKQSMESITTMY